MENAIEWREVITGAFSPCRVGGRLPNGTQLRIALNIEFSVGVSQYWRGFTRGILIALKFSDDRKPAYDKAMSQQKVMAFLQIALECSVYVAPKEPGLTYAELLEVGKRVGLQAGEIGDALPRVATQYFGRSGRLFLDHPDPMWSHFAMRREPEYRNIEAFDFMHVQLNDLIRSEGARNARIDRAVLVDRAIAAGISRDHIEAAITISALCDVVVEKDNVLSSRYGTPIEPLPSMQPVMPVPVRNREERGKIFGIVKDVVERRTDGRPKHAEPLDAFPEALARLGYGNFRLWWTQTVAELRTANYTTAPVSSLVLSAALVEGSLTFVVAHARAKNFAVFRSSDFKGEPRTWKIDELINSAASGGEAAILDEPTRHRAATLSKARQRIHAGRMLSDYPTGVPDLRPEEARDGRATAEQVVRRVLDWLERYPPD